MKGASKGNMSLCNPHKTLLGYWLGVTGVEFRNASEHTGADHAEGREGESSASQKHLGFNGLGLNRPCSTLEILKVQSGRGSSPKHVGFFRVWRV